jgi:hypothetical protein
LKQAEGLECREKRRNLTPAHSSAKNRNRLEGDWEFVTETKVNKSCKIKKLPFWGSFSTRLFIIFYSGKSKIPPVITNDAPPVSFKVPEKVPTILEAVIEVTTIVKPGVWAVVALAMVKSLLEASV